MNMTFEDYYNKYYQQVFAYILGKIHNFASAEDIAMDCFLSCYKHFDSFNPEKASFATWIYTIVNNKLKNFYRDKKDCLSIDDIEIAEENDMEHTIERAENFKLMRKHLSIALDTLSDTQKKVVIYKYYYGLDSNKISQNVGISAVNVRVQLSRALKKLRGYFDKNNINWEM